MDIKVIIEAIGYLGSALVLVSMLMTSVVRLRIINLIGSVIFAGYALAIRSYPTAIMNICLAGINIYHLVRIFNEQRSYSLVKTDINDGYFSYLLDKCDDDIRSFFPDYSLDGVAADMAYLVLCESNPACLFVGKENKDGEVEVVLDYALPAYRDTTVGLFLYRNLAKDYRTIAFRQNAENHVQYLEKIGYENKGDEGYVLKLSRLKGRS